MKYRITLNRSYYTYDSVNTRHTPKGAVVTIMQLDLDLKIADISNDRVNFHDPHVFNKVMRHLDDVQVNSTMLISAGHTLRELRDLLNFGGANNHHLYWWSIEKVEQ